MTHNDFEFANVEINIRLVYGGVNNATTLGLMHSEVSYTVEGIDGVVREVLVKELGSVIRDLEDELCDEIYSNAIVEYDDPDFYM